MAITSEPADARRDQAVLAELNVACLDWPDANTRQAFGLALPSLLGQPIAEYVDATLGKLCAAEPPEGVFCLVRRKAGSSAWAAGWEQPSCDRSGITSRSTSSMPSRTGE